VPDHDGDRTYAGLSEQRQSPPERLLVTDLKQRLRRRSPRVAQPGTAPSCQDDALHPALRPSALTHHLAEGASLLASSDGTITSS
jgi:hypothetical protein